MQRIIRDFPLATVKRVSLQVSGARACAAQHKRALPEIIAGGKKMRGLATPQMAFVVERSPCANAPVVRRGSGFPSAEKASPSVLRHHDGLPRARECDVLRKARGRSLTALGRFCKQDWSRARRTRAPQPEASNGQAHGTATRACTRREW